MISWRWQQFPILPLLLIVVVNAVFFFAFERVGAAVGAQTGTDGYREIAENLVKGKGLTYSDDRRSKIEFGYMKREPTYPFLLSVILSLTGSLNPAALWLFHTTLSLVSCFLLYGLGRKLFDSSTAILACFVYALHPISFWYSARFASELVTVPAILLCLLLIERFFTHPTGARAATVGLAVGAATLTKSACVVLLPLTLLFWIVKSRANPRRLISHAFIIILAYASLDSLWIIRNHSISGEIVPFTTNSGGAFFIGKGIVDRFDLRGQVIGENEAEEAAQNLYRSVQDEIAEKAPETSLPRLEVQTDRQLRAMAGDLIWKEPVFVLRKFLSGMLFIWFLSNTTAKSLGWMIFQMPLLAFALAELYRHRHLAFIKCFVVCVVVGYVVPYAFLLPLARYSIPVMPLVILFSSCTLARFLTSLARQAREKAPATIEVD